MPFEYLLNLLRYSDKHLNTRPKVWYSDDLFNFVLLLYWLKLGINWLIICFREHLENLLLDDWEQCDVCFSYFPNSNTLSLHRMHAHAIRDKAPSSSIQWYNCYLFCIFLIIFPFLQVSSAFTTLDWCLTNQGRLPRSSEGLVASTRPVQPGAYSNDRVVQSNKIYSMLSV